MPLGNRLTSKHFVPQGVRDPRAVGALNTSPAGRASPAILVIALSLAGCAGSSARIVEGVPLLAAAERASIARSLAAVPHGATAPWTEIETDAVGTARIVGEASGGCLPVEVMRLREDHFDTLHLDLCAGH